MSELKTLKDVRTWWNLRAPEGGWSIDCYEDAVDIVLRELDKKSARQTRKLAKSVPLRVTEEQFRTINLSPMPCTLTLVDKLGKYQPGMLAVVMEFDEIRARFTTRQTLRIVSHVWQALPGYSDEHVVLALTPVEWLS
jgi:hypothetical protein